jgi:hypothetical protein
VIVLINYFQTIIRKCSSLFKISVRMKTLGDIFVEWTLIQKNYTEPLDPYASECKNKLKA